ncbi:nuclear transport factor 2 family protein [Actinoplanes solisilvae]|uniref:nuclear transport factor 2 family protein n=1 Tax=Actinoplanes solisilvae TaxID=2486853 RepID=UPI0013E3675C|nr:nuclear transport factor 2 family protein [Actinoplanes solisilvae]
MTTRILVERFFTMLGSGADAEDIAKLFAEDVDWDVPGSASLAWTGKRSNRAEVADYLRTLAANIVPEQNVDEIEAILYDGKHAVMLGRFGRVARSTGRPYEMEVAMRFEVNGDEITKFRLYEDSHQVAGAYAE